MISSLRGTISHKDGSSLVLDVGGVGYKIHTTTTNILDLKTGEEVLLHTYLAVRENSMELFGFLEKEELEIFELLISISGIGPRTALGILNVASPKTLRQAVANEDTSYLTKVSGIGKKNADKIVLELRGKLELEASDDDKNFRTESDALEALVSLGYSERSAREALKNVPDNIEGTSDRVKSALKILSS